MLISIERGNVLNSRNFVLWHYDSVELYYSGVLFFNKKKEGKESLDFLIKCYLKGKIPFEQIYGCYAVVLYDKVRKEILVFSDNSNMHGIWISNAYIGSDIIEMGVVQEEYSIDKMALCEYYTFHRFYRTDSLVSGIYAGNSGAYYLIKDGVCREVDKGIGNICDKSSIKDPKEFFQSVGYAFNDKTVVCALTGGYDSRLITAMYNYYSKADSFISGDNMDGADIKCSRRVAKAGKIRHFHIVPDVPDADGDKLLLELFRNGQYKVAMGTQG